MKRFLVLLCALVALGCSQPSPTSRASASPTASVASRDIELAAELADKAKCAPALAWLSDPRHSLWKGDRAQIERHFKELKEGGMVEIYATGIETMEGNQVCAAFVAELPSDSAKRAKLLDLHNAFWKGYLSGASEEDLKPYHLRDTGQKYLDYNFDL